jgi:hypothetical protein
MWVVESHFAEWAKKQTSVIGGDR